jgi:hypothetical protein
MGLKQCNNNRSMKTQICRTNSTHQSASQVSPSATPTQFSNGFPFGCVSGVPEQVVAGPSFTHSPATTQPPAVHVATTSPVNPALQSALQTVGVAETVPLTQSAGQGLAFGAAFGLLGQSGMPAFATQVPSTLQMPSGAWQ